MHEIACPSCNAASQYDLTDHLHLCPFCSVTFHIELDTGKKELYPDHYIVPNACDSRQIKDLVTRWLKRLHHNPNSVEREFYVVDINGYSIPFWIVSLEAHTAWKGLVKKVKKSQFEQGGTGFIVESGQFRRNYRWAVSARANICDQWGMTTLHEPKEEIAVSWDGFPLDSTYSRGRIDPNLGVRKRVSETQTDELSAYDVREFFEFKYANGLPILSIQVTEEEALRRAKNHVNQYHYNLALANTDVLLDCRTELEIAGVQLIHLPFWHVRYIYRPDNLLRHIQKSSEKNVIIEGYAGGVLKGELMMIHRDKLWINSIVTGIAAVALFFLGTIWHPAFLIVGLFFIIVTGASNYVASSRRPKPGHETSSFFHGSEEGDEAQRSESAV